MGCVESLPQPLLETVFSPKTIESVVLIAFHCFELGSVNFLFLNNAPVVLAFPDEKYKSANPSFVKSTNVKGTNKPLFVYKGDGTLLFLNSSFVGNMFVFSTNVPSPLLRNNRALSKFHMSFVAPCCDTSKSMSPSPFTSPW